MIPVVSRSSLSVSRPACMIPAVMILLSLVSFAGRPQGNTAAHLQAAYTAEMTAAARYTVFAEKAGQEGYPVIGLLFSAASRSQSIHADNLKAALEKMGRQAEPFIAPPITAGTTKENLEASIIGEDTEAGSIYPDYIATARGEKETHAVKAMRWAMETEIRHTIYYRNALTALNSDAVKDLPKTYQVCPKCGNTYNTVHPEDMCSFCGTPGNRFISFGK